MFSARHLPVVLCSGNACFSTLPFSEIKKAECDISSTDYKSDGHLSLSFSLGGTQVTLQMRTMLGQG